MSKAANIYWDNATTAGTSAPTRTITRKRRPRAVVAERRSTPFWVSFAIVVSIFVMLGISINFRAWTAVREEAAQNTQLSSQIQNLQDENLALQEEIHGLKTDPRVIQQEARKIGIVGLKPEKVSVPAN